MRTPCLHIAILMAFLANTLGPIPTTKAEPVYSVEGEFHLPAPGILVHLSPPLDPPILKGIKVHPDNPFRFDFILDKGDSFSSVIASAAKQSQQEQLKAEATKLIKYFLASLTIPEKDLWVNLSPYEKDRIIPQSFGLTEMGRDLLAEDYMLKQITASLIYPEDEVGKRFWKRIYEEAAKKYGTTNIPVNTFNKVWIVPEKAVVYENAKAGTAYVVEAKLKVMLEEDYLSLQKHNQVSLSSPNVSVGDPNTTNTSQLGSQITREIIIPELTTEVNEGKNFAQLRQVYNSLILATWYKKKIKDSILEQVYADQNKVKGLSFPKYNATSSKYNVSSPNVLVGDPEHIYQQYLQAFKKGVYNYIKEDQDPITQQLVPRKYFSGGIEATNLSKVAFQTVSTINRAQLSLERDFQITADLAMSTSQIDQAMTATPQEVRQPGSRTFSYEGLAGSVDLEHFVFAQQRLALKNLTERKMRNVLRFLNIDDQGSSDANYGSILQSLASGRMNAEALDAIIGDTFKDPRLDIQIKGQNGNALSQSIYEAISNSLDALGFDIGQFGKGIKQILHWLEATGEDGIDVYTLKRGESQGYRLRMVKASTGQIFISLNAIDRYDFKKQSGNNPHGTVIKLKIKSAIDKTITKHRGISQKEIIDGVRKRYDYVTGVHIYTQMEGEDSPKLINDFENKKVVVGPAFETPASTENAPAISVRVDAHTVTIIDNGEGMDAPLILRMFVPKQGSKHPKPLSSLAAREELAKARVVHNTNPKAAHRVSFARNGEVIAALNIPSDIEESATVPGGLMVELGGLLDVQESRDKIIIPLSLKAKEKTNFHLAIEHVVLQLANSSLTDEEKVQYINTIAVGLDALIQKNDNNNTAIARIREDIYQILIPIISRLREAGYVILPNDANFDKLEIPQDKTGVIFLHEKLFDWKGAQDLENLGGQRIPGIRIKIGEERVPVVVVPFKEEDILHLGSFSKDWHRFNASDRVPVIKTDRVVVVAQLPGTQRLVELAQKKLTREGLTEEEKRELSSLEQLLSIVTAQEVVTGYEVVAPKEHLVREEQFQFVEAEGADAPVVNKFLKDLPSRARATKQSQVEEQDQIPADANMRLVLMKDGRVLNLENGKPLELPGPRHVGSIQPLPGGKYIIYLIDTNLTQKSFCLVRKNESKESGYEIYADQKYSELSLSPRKDIVIYEDNEQTKYVLDINLQEPEAEGKRLIADRILGEDVKLSPDGKYVVHLMADNFDTLVVSKKTSESGTKIIELEYKNLNGYEISFDRYASNILYLKTLQGYYLFDIDKEDNEPINKEPLQALRTDATGSFTVMKGTDGKLSVYLHGSKRIINSRDVGGEIESIFFDYDDDLKKCCVEVKGGLKRILYFDTNGVTQEPSFEGTSTGLHEVIYSDLISFEDINKIADVSFNGQDHEKIYKDPHFNLIIDKTDPDNIVAIDPVTGKEFKYLADEIIGRGTDPDGKQWVLSYDAKSDMTVHRFEGDNNNSKDPQNWSHMHDYIYLVDLIFTDDKKYFIGTDVEGNLDLYHNADGELENIPIADRNGKRLNRYDYLGEVPNIQKTSRFENNYWDGKYFIFSNPQTGETIYIDPHQPDKPYTVMPGQPRRQSPLRQNNGQIPDDAHLKLQIKGDQLVNLENGKPLDIPAGHKITEIEALADGRYLVYLKSQGGRQKSFCFIRKDSSKESGYNVYLYREYKSELIISPKKDMVVYDEPGSEDLFDFRIALGDEERFEGLIGARKDGANIKFSKDGRYDAYIAPITGAGESEGEFLFEEIGTLGVCKVFRPLNPKDSEIWFSRYADNIVYLKTDKGYYLFDMDQPGEGPVNQEPLQALRTDATGSFTVMKDKNGELSVYLHGSKKIVTSEDIGRKIELINTEWLLNGQKRFVVESDSLLGPNVYFDRNRILKEIPDELRFGDGEFGEVFGINSVALFGDSRVSVGTTALVSTTLIGQEHEKIYKDPHFNLVIDETDPNNRMAIDPVTSEKFGGLGADIIATGTDQGKKWILSVHSGLHPYITQTWEGDMVITENGGSDWVVVSGRDIFDLDDVVFSDDKKYFLGLDKNDVELYEITKEKLENIPISMNDGGLFKAADFPHRYWDGKYFVLSNPQTGDIYYIDPQNPQAALTQDQEQAPGESNEAISKARQIWQEEVLSRRDAWVVQARQAYQQLIEMVPEEFHSDILSDFRLLWTRVYQAQQEEIIRLYEKVLDHGAEETLGHDLENGVLPFDLMQKRLERIMPVLKSYIAAMIPFLRQQETHVAKSLYQHLMRNVLSMAVEKKWEQADTMDWDQTQLDAMAYGLDVSSSEELEALSSIGKFIQQMKEIVGEGNMTESMQNTIQILSLACRQDPHVKLPIILTQLGKIMGLRQVAKERFVKELLEQMKIINMQQVENFLKNPSAENQLGKAADYILYLTQEVDTLKFKEQWIPEGEDIVLPADGVEISQIMSMENQRSQGTQGDVVMSFDDFEKEISKGELPASNESEEAELLKNTTVQREPGAYTAEASQNVRDATRDRQGKLTVEFYLQKNADGFLESVEEIGDNGTGALKEMALILPISTKAEGQQIDLTGFFGTGKYTIFEGVDRLEMINRNHERAVMFTFVVNRDDSGRAVSLKLVKVRKVHDDRVKEGLTIRRIKKIENTLPELDQMLAKRNWRTFAGLAQDEHFSIVFLEEEEDADGIKRQVEKPLKVSSEILSEADFIAPNFNKNKEPTNYGKVRIWSVKDMPSQILDKVGLRVGEIKKEYLNLVPKELRRYFSDLNIVIQIPLPLIRNRSAFENENEYLGIIQRAVAVEFYRALAYKVYTQRSPQFKFPGLPDDWLTNPSYDNVVDPRSPTYEIVEKINSRTKLKLKELQDIMDPDSFLEVILAINFKVPENQEEISLIAERWAYQEELAATDQERRSILEALGKRLGITSAKTPNIRKNSLFGSIMSQGLMLKMIKEFKLEESIIEPGNRNEELLMSLAPFLSVRLGVPIDSILLVKGAPFRGMFTLVRGKKVMVLNKSLAQEFGQPGHVGTIDGPTDTIVHETAHLLEKFIEFAKFKGDEDDFWEEGWTFHKDSTTTHQAIGPFAEAMKYIAAMSLANWDSSVFKDHAQITTHSLAQRRGGIDLTPANMNVQTLNSGGEIKFHLDPAMLVQLQSAPGFVPVIINIQPMNNLRKFLGA